MPFKNFHFTTLKRQPFAAELLRNALAALLVIVVATAGAVAYMGLIQ